MAPEATPNDETAPLFVYERAMPAMGGGRILNRRRQRKGPIADMACSYTGEQVFHANPSAKRQAKLCFGFSPRLRRSIAASPAHTTLPGFISPFGSKACLMVRIICISSGLL